MNPLTGSLGDRMKSQIQMRLRGGGMASIPTVIVCLKSRSKIDVDFSFMGVIRTAIRIGIVYRVGLGMGGV